MKTYKARGIVLHTVKYGETSLILYTLTDTVGRQTYMVQGVRGGKSRGRGGALFQPMFVLDFVGLESPKMELHRIKEVRPAFPLTSIPFDIRKSTISLFMAEVLYRLIREAEPLSPVFDFARGSVEALDGMTDGVANFHIWFLARLSPYLGFHPGNEYSPSAWFDIREGMYTPVEPGHGLSFDREKTRLLSELLQADIHDLAGVKLSRGARSGFLEAMLSYFGYHLDTIHQIRSVQILKEVF
ncbi:MAG: DNA repair protein RecO [Rikenellaceae bacterium]|nr:DNA repair protein RecO [Rikenellaceae bacterium]